MNATLIRKWFIKKWVQRSTGFYLILLFYFFPMIACPAQTLSGLDISLSSAEEGKLRVKDKIGEHGAVLLFLDPDCPVSQKYGATIRKLSKDFEEMGISTIAIYPVVNIDMEKVKTFAQDYQYDFTQLLDPHMELTRSIEASVTPEAYFINSAGEIVYHGAINNWYYELGRYRRVVTQHYLKDAVSLYLQNQPIRHKETEAIGCIIGTGMKSDSENMHH